MILRQPWASSLSSLQPLCAWPLPRRSVQRAAAAPRCCCCCSAAQASGLHPPPPRCLTSSLHQNLRSRHHRPAITKHGHKRQSRIGLVTQPITDPSPTLDLADLPPLAADDLVVRSARAAL